jgi:hypothetical protein
VKSVFSDHAVNVLRRERLSAIRLTCQPRAALLICYPTFELSKPADSAYARTLGAIRSFGRRCLSILPEFHFPHLVEPSALDSAQRARFGRTEGIRLIWDNLGESSSMLCGVDWLTEHWQLRAGVATMGQSNRNQANCARNFAPNAPARSPANT